MKTSIIYAYVTLIGITNAQDACVEGKRVTINPGYTVEYKCDKYRSGQRYNNVLSHQDCAVKCQVDGLDVCTYQAAKKMCIVGDPNGKEGTSIGATYMVRVEEEPEDPFAEDDPFAEACEEQKVDLEAKLDNLKGELDNLKRELDSCRDNVQASPKKPPTCLKGKWGQGWYELKNGMTLASCKTACNADPKCISYSSNGSASGSTACYLYEKETADLQLKSVPNFPNWVQYDKRC